MKNNVICLNDVRCKKTKRENNSSPRIYNDAYILCSDGDKLPLSLAEASYLCRQLMRYREKNTSEAIM